MPASLQHLAQRDACHLKGQFLIWRGEENRGHHQAIQDRAGERSVDGSRR